MNETPTPSTAEPSVEQRAREMTREFMRRVHALPSQSDIEGFAKDCLTRALQSTDEVVEVLEECADFVQPFNRAQDLLDRIEALLLKLKGQSE